MIKASRIRASDLVMLAVMRLDVVKLVEVFQDFILANPSKTFGSIADEMGTGVQNVRNWYYGHCKPEGVNLARMIRYVYVHCDV
jgi:hypothetical protein